MGSSLPQVPIALGVSRGHSRRTLGRVLMGLSRGSRRVLIVQLQEHPRAVLGWLQLCAWRS
jgi:hypothetical protein